MMCLPHVGLETDIPYWISKADFLRQFSQPDFHCRNVENVTYAYLDDWFFQSQQGLCFCLATVHFATGKSEFISGRHRTAVLLHYLDEIPIAVATRWTPAPPFLLEKRPMCLETPFWLPDLPIVQSFEVGA